MRHARHPHQSDATEARAAAPARAVAGTLSSLCCGRWYRRRDRPTCLASPWPAAAAASSSSTSARRRFLPLVGGGLWVVLGLTREHPVNHPPQHMGVAPASGLASEWRPQRSTAAVQQKQHGPHRTTTTATPHPPLQAARLLMPVKLRQAVDAAAGLAAPHPHPSAQGGWRCECSTVSRAAVSNAWMSLKGMSGRAV